MTFAKSSKDLTATVFSVIFSSLLLCSLVNCIPGDYDQTCDRVPKDTRASKTPGDNGFRIKLAGNPPPEKYVPNQVYTISVNGTYPNQRFLGFSLVAVPLNAQDETTSMGTFQHLNSGVTKFDRNCPHIVTHMYQQLPKSGIDILWTAPSTGTGCVEFRATILEYADIWYKDDGALTRVFCEDTGTTENHRAPDMLPECCACGTAKYMLTFHGLWSRQTHPKDYPDPTHKRLMHWSNIVGASHAKKYAVWQYGDYASKGIKEVCEFGYSRTLEQEMRKHSHDVRTVIKTSGIWWKDPEGLRQSRVARFSVDKKNHLLSILSMLGPSPDWCVGVSALDLCLSNCSWAGDLTIDLYPWDAGTDDGVSYMSPNSVSRPQQKIHKITKTFPDSHSSPFHGRHLEPMARMEIKRVSPKPGALEQCTEDDVDEDEGFSIGDDDGLSEMEKKKLMMMNAGKCGTNDWLDWSDCTVTCGVGMRFRKRMFSNPMVDENMCPGIEMMEKENCIGIENTCEDPDAECAATEWSEWSPCSVTCGKGVRERRRYYMKRISVSTCNREMAQTEMCIGEIMDCAKARMMKNFTAICSEEKDVGPCRGSFTRWYFDTGMRKCLPYTYGGCRGNNNRFMTMEECQEMCSLGDDIGSEEVMPGKRPGHKKHRGVPCMVTPWTEFSECSETCGKSFQIKTRMVKREPENGGKACPTRLKKRKKCHVPECPGAASGASDGSDCMITDWTSWSECSVTCGQGIKTRRRMIKREAENGGKKCPKKIFKERPCKMDTCSPSSSQIVSSVFTTKSTTTPRPRAYSTPRPRDYRPTQPRAYVPTRPKDCQMGDWTEWSPCPPRTCVQERTRSVIHREDHGGLTCGPRLQRRHCANDQCYRRTRARIPGS